MITKSFYISRRRFLKTSAATAVATGLPLWFLDRERAEAAPAPRPLSPNDRPGIALVGCGGQGTGDCGNAKRLGDVIAVCDVDEKHAAAASSKFSVEGKVAPARFKDFRKLMERDDVHVIITGTPDHWHTLINMLAVKTGKDVYTEKPLTLTIDEGKRLVKVVRESGRILQVGSQQRSDSKFRLACELVRNGRIGKLQHMIVGLPTGPHEGPFKPIPVPSELNWDFYLGQTPKKEYVGVEKTKKVGDKEEVTYESKCTHWNFRWWRCFSGGQLTDWGAHHCDIAQWGNGTERSGPVEVEGKSLVEMIPGGYDAPSKYRIEYKYANGVTMTVADGSTPTERDVYNDKKGTRNGIQFIGTEGWIFVTRGKIDASKPELLTEPLPDNAIRLYKSDDHMGNFFEGVRSRKAPICDVEIGHRSISIAHLGGISIRLGGPHLQWNPAREEFTGENAKEANQWLAREMRKPYDYSFIGMSARA